MLLRKMLVIVQITLGLICVGSAVQADGLRAAIQPPPPTPVRKQSVSNSVPASSPSWPGEKTVWEGFDRYDFEVDGRPAFVVEPSDAAPGNPWVWRARFPDFHTGADLLLLERGFHIAHIDTQDMLGSPRAMKHWDAFYTFATEHGLAQRVAMEGVSRGGLFVYGFAARWPERVMCIYCDTPVGDIRSWPGGKGTGDGDAETWQKCLKEYGLDETTAAEFKGNPIDKLRPIADADIPVLHIVSLSDVIVPPAENTFLLAERYRKLGGTIDIIEVKMGTEESGGHHFAHPDPVRVADFIERHTGCLTSADDYFSIRGSLDNCRIRFENEKRGRVAFLGGSITKMDGWRGQVCDYLEQRFPETEFDFIDAGVSSTGSTPGAFRLASDVLAKGEIDLLFEEAAVNDLHNQRTPVEITRGMEGILRHARRANPMADVVVMHFVDPQHMENYRSGDVPQVIGQQESVAKHYGVSTIQLARQITEQIDAGQFDWKNDFKDLHPSSYGHRIYASTIRRFLSTAWSAPLGESVTPVEHPMPEVIDPFSYDRGRYLPLESAQVIDGFRLEAVCDPASNGVGGEVRPGFHGVPMWVAEDPGASLSLKFRGRAVGIWVVAGPDAGCISYSIDDSEANTVDLFTQWSGDLHLPWVHVLASDLSPGDHELKIKVSTQKNEHSNGNACRIVRWIVND